MKTTFRFFTCLFLMGAFSAIAQEKKIQLRKWHFLLAISAHNKNLQNL
tara:strand:- start:18911 stop:19054 length:144 start_codon:yes stop_codon:yes gene_type:complete